MKKYLFILLLFIACDSPSESLGFKVLYEYHYPTVDLCRGIDVSGDVLVAAASYNGYFKFDIIDQNGFPVLDSVFHLSDINQTVGDDAAYDVKIAGALKDMTFILDDVDNILIHHFDNNNVQTLTESCGSSYLFRSIALSEDIPDTTILFTLQKHTETVGEDPFGNPIEYNSTTVGDREFYFIDGATDDFEGASCQPLINNNIQGRKIFYADDLLTMTEGPKVHIYSYDHYRTYNESFDDINDNQIWDKYCAYEGNGVWASDFSTEEECDDSGSELEWIDESWDDVNFDHTCCEYKDGYLELLDSFYIQGGEAQSLFTKDNFIVAGYSNDRGCYMALLDLNGSIINNLTFADGYSINAIDYDPVSGILALGAENSGIIIYEWHGGLEVNLLGRLDVGNNNKVYDLDVSGNNIYVASENGISIYKIEG